MPISNRNDNVERCEILYKIIVYVVIDIYSSNIVVNNNIVAYNSQRVVRFSHLGTYSRDNYSGRTQII